MKAAKDHPIQKVIGDISKGVKIQHSFRKVCNHMDFISQTKPNLS